MVPKQKPFGEFIADRYGPKWVYAARTTQRIRDQYPGHVVITPKQQRQLQIDYTKEWGREHDFVFWQMLCALRATSTQLDFCGFDADTHIQVTDAIDAAQRVGS